MLELSRRGFMGLLSILPFASLFISGVKADSPQSQPVKPDTNHDGGVIFDVYFIHGTDFEYGAKVVSSHPFLASRGKNVSIYFLRSSQNQYSIERAEIFVHGEAVSRLPKFFIGELRRLSPRIYRVERM